MADPLPDLDGTLDDLHGTLRIIENLIANPPFLDAGYLGTREHGIHIRRLKLADVLIRREIERVEGLSSARRNNAAARAEDQRAKAKTIMLKHPEWDAGQVARKLSEDRHDEAEKLEPDEREAYLYGWMDRTIEKNIVSLFPVKQRLRTWS